MGGRLATRTTADDSLRAAPATLQAQPLIFDHAAQFFTASDPAFVRAVERWMAEGWVHIWDGVVGTVNIDGSFRVDDRAGSDVASGAKLVATGGMRQLAQHITQDLQRQGAAIKRPCWIAEMTSDESSWHLRGRGRHQGSFDCVAIAHNGKCADKLLRPAGVPLVAAQMRSLRLSSVWVAMVAFEAPVDTPHGFEGAFVGGCNVLAWVANNTAKLQIPDNSGTGSKGDQHSLQCWTLMSTPQFGKQHKVPQERVPSSKAAQVLI